MLAIRHQRIHVLLDADGEVADFDAKDRLEGAPFVKVDVEVVPVCLFTRLWHVRYVACIRDGEVGEGIRIEILFEVASCEVFAGTKRS